MCPNILNEIKIYIIVIKIYSLRYKTANYVSGKNIVQVSELCVRITLGGRNNNTVENEISSPKETSKMSFLGFKTQNFYSLKYILYSKRSCSPKSDVFEILYTQISLNDFILYANRRKAIR